MPLKGIIHNKIDHFFENKSEFDKYSADEKFEVFSLVQVMKFYEIDFEDILDGIIDTGDDYGIDAIYSFIDGKLIKSVEDIHEYWSPDSKIMIFLAQSKNESGFKEVALLKIQDGLENIFETDKVLKGNPALKIKGNIIRKLWEKWHTSQNKNDIKIKIDYITLGEKKSINHKVFDKQKKMLDYLSHLNFQSTFNFIDQKEIFDLSSVKSYSKIIEAIAYMDYDLEHNEDVEGKILIVSGNKFFDFLTDDNDEIDDHIFELNVRDYQQDSKEVNKNIKETLASNKRSNFWCMNNGITILTTGIKKKSNKFNLENYYIINGCQTSYSIWEYLKEHKNVNDFELIIKLIKTNDVDVSLDVIQATNSQIPIDYPSLRSQEPIHKAIESSLKSLANPIYYERRNNFYRRRGFSITSIINPKKLFQVLKSIYRKEPSKARSSPTKSFKDEHDQLFNLGFDLKYYNLATLLYFKVTALIKSYKKEFELDEQELDIINNGSLHLMRIILALLVGNNNPISLSNKAHDLIKKYDHFMVKIASLDVEGGGIMDLSFDILSNSVSAYRSENTDLTVTNILKKSDFDSGKLNEEIMKHFN